jgi:competence protein ComEC
VTPYGVFANLLAMPVVSALVMPAGLLGLAAMPFGFDGVFWRLMDVGIQWMIVVTQWVAALPGAIGRIAAFGQGPLIAATFGIILLGLLRTPLRWAGAGVLALSITWAMTVKSPEVLISGDGHSVAVRGRDGRLQLMRSSKDSYLLKEWLGADADLRLPNDASLGDGAACDEAGCVTALADGRLVALALQPDAFADDCARAVLIVTSKQPPKDCAAQVIDADSLRVSGAMALRRSGDGFVATSIRPTGVDRPWSPAVGEPSEPQAGAGGAVRRPVDATPAEADVQADEVAQ